MKRLLTNIFYSFPIQLLIIHFRKYQILLIFWFVLYSIINSNFLKDYGADALFFVPEYLNQVNFLSACLLGIAVGVFFMSWNITTFILHSKRFRFLAAASKPFLKYCINNALLPLFFLIFYLIKAIQFNSNKELISIPSQLLLISGFLFGLLSLLLFSFVFFFGADKTIVKSIVPVIATPTQFKQLYGTPSKNYGDAFGMKVTYYLSVKLTIKKARNVYHYSHAFLDAVFKRHHFAGMIGLILAFIFLIIIGFFSDNKYFQAPAAVSCTIFFALMVAVIGALTYFLESWSLLFVIALVGIIDVLYQHEIIDPRNKAYGINYFNKTERPSYTKQTLTALCTANKIDSDKAAMLTILQRWKAKQHSDKPVMVFINVSGGGLRSSTFVMKMLQQLDSASNGQLMKQTVLISGASGGMLSAAFFRELYLQKQKGQAIDLYNPKYIGAITQDLLNPLFSSMLSRDLFAPTQKFKAGNFNYIKDRGYAFEQKLLENSDGLLAKQLKDYTQDEQAANMPLMIFNSVITRDGRKMMIGAQPISFMMKPSAFANNDDYSPDAVDFMALFAKQQASNIRLLTALRMNATFPYVLPNVWLPTTPIIDVMDAGLRDNYGEETTLRFIDNFKQWISNNTSGIVLIECRDRLKDNWQQPVEIGSITDVLVKPATMLQQNWFKLQDYYQADQLNYLHISDNLKIQQYTFMYEAAKEEKMAALNFHLTAVEKANIITSFNNLYNKTVLKNAVAAIKR